MAEKQWRAGVAVFAFPVEAGTPLAGYAARTSSAVGTLDELAIAALVLEDVHQRLVILSADVVAVDADLRDEIASSVGLKRSELAICASHTHSGPAGVVARLHPADRDRLNCELRSRFVLTAARAIAVARSAMTPVDLLFGSSETEGVAANRNSASGSYDPQISVLATRQEDGALQAVLVHFACHPTILGAGNLSVSSDFPGVLRRNVSASLAQPTGSPVVLFVNGAAGDVSTRFTRRAQDVEETERLGGSLASSAIKALANARMLEGPLRHARASMSLPARALWTDDHQDTVSHAPVEAPTHGSSAASRIDETRHQGAAMLAALTALPVGADPAILELDAWGLGDLAMVAVPGELVSSFASQIRFAAPTSTLILGYTNGYVGYLADRTAHVQRTYEALASPFGPEAGERVVEGCIALVRQVTPDGRSVQIAQESNPAIPE
jgi:Neutral/alkaline non-lysosomal ceramidase, N-terminal